MLAITMGTIMGTSAYVKDSYRCSIYAASLAFQRRRSMVQIDLSLPKFASLIESARRIILSNRKAEHNHIDLATGAFIEQVRKKIFFDQDAACRIR